MTTAADPRDSGVFDKIQDDVGPTWEMEVIAADMETRLRGAILRLVRPALDQVTDLTGRLEELQKQVSHHDNVIREVELQRQLLTQHGSFAHGIKDQLDQLSESVRKLDRQSAADLFDIRNKCDELEQRAEKEQGSLGQFQRDISRCWEELGRIQDLSGKDKEHLWDGLSACNKKADKGREECMEYIRELRIQREDLIEDLYGESKGLTKLTRDLADLAKFAAPIPTLQAGLADVTKRVDTLEIGQADVSSRLVDNKDLMNSVRADIDNKIKTMNEKFRTEANGMVSHHASLMKDIRRDYIDEIGANKSLRDEIVRFQKATDSFCQQISLGLKSESRRIDAIHREFLVDLEEEKKRRKKDRASVEQQLTDMKKQVQTSEDVGQQVNTNVEFLSRIIGLVLEGERLSNAMMIQDFADRGAEKWLCLPQELGRQPEGPFTPDALESKSAWQRKVGGEMVPLDWRKGLVAAGYQPGQVPYQGLAYERRDLMLLQHKLLQKAHSALSKGPSTMQAPQQQRQLKSDAYPTPQSSRPAAAAAAAAPAAPGPPNAPLTALQPGARGGQSVGEGNVNPTVSSSSSQAVGPPARASTSATPPEDARDFEQVSSRGKGSQNSQRIGSRQRPGSQDQPHAVGSRGGMLGGLGETEPHDHQKPRSNSSERVRLPAIGGEPGRSGAMTAR